MIGQEMQSTRRDVFTDLINQITIDSRRSMENSLLAAVGVTILGLVTFIGQIPGETALLAASITALGQLLLLFFLLVFAKMANLALEALFDHYSRTYGIYVFSIWALSVLSAIGGLAYVAGAWFSALATWAPAR